MSFTLLAHGSGGANVTLNTLGADLIVILGVGWNQAGSNVVTENQGNTLVPDNSYTQAGNAATMQFWHCANPNTNAAHTFNMSGSFLALAVAAFSGSASSPLDQQNGSSTAGAGTLQPGSITPTQNNELVCYGLADAFAGSVSVDIGTIIEQIALNPGTSFAIAFAYNIQTTATAIDPTWTDASSARKEANIISFKAVAATSVNITGVSATGSANAVAPSLRSSLTGASATGSADAIGVSVPNTVTLSGAASTASAGTVTPGIGGSVSVSGASAVGAAGVVAPNVSGAIAGASAHGVAGSVTVDVPATAAGYPLITIMRDTPVAAVGSMGDTAVPVIGRLRPSGPQPRSVAQNIRGVSAQPAVITVSGSRNLLPTIAGVSAAGSANAVTVSIT